MDSRLEEPITLRMTAPIWAGVDAGVDNVVSLAVVDGDEQAVSIGWAIRERVGTRFPGWMGSGH